MSTGHPCWICTSAHSGFDILYLLPSGITLCLNAVVELHVHVWDFEANAWKSRHHLCTLMHTSKCCRLRLTCHHRGSCSEIYWLKVNRPGVNCHTGQSCTVWDANRQRIDK